MDGADADGRHWNLGIELEQKFHFEEAFKEFQQSYERGNQHAGLKMSEYLMTGRGPGQDEEAGFELLLKLGKGGMPEAMYSMATLYDQAKVAGKKTGKKNSQQDQEKKAYKWFKRLAEHDISVPTHDATARTRASKIQAGRDWLASFHRTGRKHKMTVSTQQQHGEAH